MTWGGAAAAPQRPARSSHRRQKPPQTLLVGAQAACVSSPETPTRNGRWQPLDEGQTLSPERPAPPARRARPLTEGRAGTGGGYLESGTGRGTEGPGARRPARPGTQTPRPRPRPPPLRSPLTDELGATHGGCGGSSCCWSASGAPARQPRPPPSRQPSRAKVRGRAARNGGLPDAPAEGAAALQEVPAAPGVLVHLPVRGEGRGAWGGGRGLFFLRAGPLSSVLGGGGGLGWPALLWQWDGASRGWGFVLFPFPQACLKGWGKIFSGHLPVPAAQEVLRGPWPNPVFAQGSLVVLPSFASVCD